MGIPIFHGKGIPLSECYYTKKMIKTIVHYNKPRILYFTLNFISHTWDCHIQESLSIRREFPL